MNHVNRQANSSLFIFVVFWQIYVLRAFLIFNIVSKLLNVIDLNEEWYGILNHKDIC